MIVNNPATLLLHFAIDMKHCCLAKCNIGMVLKVRVEIRGFYSVLIFKLLSFLNSVLAFIPNSLAAAVRLPLLR
jgi:hypothetical protein